MAKPRRLRGTESLSLLFCQDLKPPVGLPAHVLRRGPSRAATACHRVVHPEHCEDVLGDALLDRLHGGERQLMKWNILRRRLGDDTSGDVMRLAEGQLVRAHQPIGEVGGG